jgi:hypothetical protein
LRFILGKLKSFSDYWRNFCNDLVLMSRAVTQMLLVVGLNGRKARAGAGGFWGY